MEKIKLMQNTIKTLLRLTFFFSFGLLQAANKTEQIRAGKIVESCVQLKASQTIQYSFTSSAAVDFNIHYHLGKKVEYPVKLNAVKKHSASFKANLAQHYCLMWSNRGNETVQLSFKHGG